MKKSLVLAMTMAMGVTASAYASNPFADVPAGHWAYDTVAQLADAGVVEGTHGFFVGNRLATRYEFAQIVAKAMAKGANCDKLAAEFADELNALGIRVTKLEKKVDNVKITGQARFHLTKQSRKNKQEDTRGGLRTRIFVNGQINDDWSYTGMLQNYHEIKKGVEVGAADNDKVELTRAYVEGRLGGVKVLAGRWNEFFITDTILDDFIDGIYGEYGIPNGKVYGIAGKGVNENKKDNDRIYVAGVAQKIGPVDAAFNWFKTDYDGKDHQIYNINADWPFAKDFSLTYRYMWVGKKVVDNTAKDGWFAQVNYKGADPAVANTWGLRARYFDQPKNVYIYPTYDFYAYGDSDGGYKGWNLGGDYTLGKNILLQFDYYDTKAKLTTAGNSGRAKDRCMYGQLYFFF